MTLTTTCQVFPSNTRNKDELIKALLLQLRQLGFLTCQSERDADIFIVDSALQEALSIFDVEAEDTDILVLIIHHWYNSKNDIFFNTEKRQNSTKVKKWWNIVCFKKGNASDWTDILFAHAYGGCDTTSTTITKVSCFTYFLRLCYLPPLKNWTLILR